MMRYFSMFLDMAAQHPPPVAPDPRDEFAFLVAAGMTPAARHIAFEVALNPVETRRAASA
ncbi:hypothetical protein G5B40_18215 [Pikeienuella piscinae]|uniref:Uncharacterized protein n=1 Tax=Pikeienuella piscinae TaxID=2748098 RepID=A0A7M3T5C3_9RHOB|nr:hypothetical protein [Pikeienuella piscinae]QIE57204.1 hypothetical protein G5B40_18215 [Pikeienuella piscinae]